MNISTVDHPDILSTICHCLRQTKKYERRIPHIPATSAHLLSFAYIALLRCVWFENQMEWNVMARFSKNGSIPFLCLIGVKCGMG